MICFEFPLAEKIRTLLRLEDIFKRLAFFQQQEQGHAHYIALLVLFELLDSPLFFRREFTFHIIEQGILCRLLATA